MNCFYIYVDNNSRLTHFWQKSHPVTLNYRISIKPSILFAEIKMMMMIVIIIIIIIAS